MVAFLIAGHGLWGMRASGAAAPGLQGSDSVVVAHGLNCLATGGIFADQGWNASLHRKVYS